MRAAGPLFAFLAMLIISGASRAAKPAIGPFDIVSGDSSAVLTPGFASQLRLVFDSAENVSCECEDRKNTLTMRARRIRPVISLTLPRYSLSLRLHLSTAPGSVELMDFYFDYYASADLRIRAGQYKIPFTRYRIQSFSRLTFVDWSVVTAAFGAERQMGIAIHNGYERAPRRAYVFGVFSGQNARAAHAVTFPGRFGTEGGNPSGLSDPAPREDFHPELVLHLGYNARSIDVSSDTDRTKADIRYSLMLSAAWDMDARYQRDFVLRLAPEFLAKYRGFSASAVWYAGWAEEGESRTPRHVMCGWLVQCAYRLCQRYEISGRYALFDLKDDPLRQDEVRAGVNVYILDHQIKWQTDFGRLEGGNIDTEQVDYILRSQMQLAF
jgi:hypothetical protein